MENSNNISFENISFRITPTNVPGTYEQSVRASIIAGYKWFQDNNDKKPLLNLSKTSLDIRVYLFDLLQVLENAETISLPVALRVLILSHLKIAVNKGWNDYLSMIRDMRKNAQRISY